MLQHKICFAIPISSDILPCHAPAIIKANTQMVWVTDESLSSLETSNLTLSICVYRRFWFNPLFMSSFVTFWSWIIELKYGFLIYSLPLIILLTGPKLIKTIMAENRHVMICWHKNIETKTSFWWKNRLTDNLRCISLHAFLQQGYPIYGDTLLE